MAFCDYHPCDLCGERKTFYDADMNVEQHKDGSLTYDGHEVYALCHVCRETHEIIIAPKPTPEQQERAGC